MDRCVDSQNKCKKTSVDEMPRATDRRFWLPCRRDADALIFVASQEERGKPVGRLPRMRRCG